MVENNTLSKLVNSLLYVSYVNLLYDSIVIMLRQSELYLIV